MFIAFLPSKISVCRYIDSNYVNALSPHDMASNCLRRSVLGSLRYGKCFVLDLQDVDVWSTMEHQFNEACPGLLHLLVSGKIVHEEHYGKLVKPEDGHEYALGEFRDDWLASFRFVVVTSLKFPDDALLNSLKAFRVKADA